MIDQLAQKAITAAIACDWQQAIGINEQIIKISPENTAALNRAARAYLKLGDISKAKELSEKVLAIDPMNSIAEKCLQKCTTLLQNGSQISEVQGEVYSLESIFLEEPGKTKIVSLIHTGDAEILASLQCGDPVRLMPRMHRVSITTLEETYVGRLPDDIASRLIYLVGKGNDYQAFVKTATCETVKIFIREVVRAPELTNTHSFPR